MNGYYHDGVLIDYVINQNHLQVNIVLTRIRQVNVIDILIYLIKKKNKRVVKYESQQLKSAT